MMNLFGVWRNRHVVEAGKMKAGGPWKRGEVALPVQVPVQAFLGADLRIPQIPFRGQVTIDPLAYLLSISPASALMLACR